MLACAQPVQGLVMTLVCAALQKRLKGLIDSCSQFDFALANALLNLDISMHMPACHAQN